MLQVTLVSRNNPADKVATAIRQAKNSQGEPVNAVIVTFSDNTEARCSANHLDANGRTLFLTEALRIANGYKLTYIDGDAWIVDSRKTNIKLS